MGALICPCGANATRSKSKFRNGKHRFRVKCEACGRKTHWHRPNGGDLSEWKEIVERNAQ